MQILTPNGWRNLAPRTILAPGHTPSMLEREGITPDYDPVAAMAEYASRFGNGLYFTYASDGRTWQSRPAIHPLPGMT